MASRLGSGVFYGVATQRMAAGDLLLVLTRYAPRTRVAAHWHERPYFCYLEAGSFEEQSGGCARRYRPGTLIYHPAGETHTDRFADEGGVCFNIELPPDLLMACESRELAALGVAAHFAAGPANRLATQMSREFRRTPSPSSLVLEGLGLALIGEACRTPPAAATKRPPKWLDDALELIHDRFREPIGLGTVAAGVGVHAVHLARRFRDHRGVTVGEYIRALRIDFARRELTGSRRTVSEIAHASGFADHAHFCRSFRAHVGMTPSRFRASRADH